MQRLWFLCFIPALLYAQPDVDLQQAFLDLRHDGVVMNLAAHPDDEDGATLAYYRMKWGVKTYSVFFTRGEGGQNERGPELYEDLGVLRTAETEEAARIQGTEPVFLNLMDFGFSKTATETFPKWGGQMETLRRLVFVIRKFRPDILFTFHNTIDGHGHHQAVAITAMAAFDAAADSTMFPEQFKIPGIAPWQPSKLFFRIFNRPDFGLGSAGTPDVVNIIDEENTARRMTYFDIAALALRMHKTQGMDRADLRRFSRGQSLFKLIRSKSLFDKDSTTFFGGIDIWRDDSLVPLTKIHEQLAMLHQGMLPDSALSIASSLLSQISRETPTSSLASRVLQHWTAELEQLIMLVCGVKASLVLDDPVVVPQQKVTCRLQVESNDCRISALKYEFALPSGWVMNERPDAAPELSSDRYARDFELIVGGSPVLTLPSAVAQYRPIETEQVVAVAINCMLSGKPVLLKARALIDIAPHQTFTVTPKVARVAPDKLTKGKMFTYVVRNFRPIKTAGVVRVIAPKGWSAESSSFVIGKEDSTATGELLVIPPMDAQQGDYTLTFKTDYVAEKITVRVFPVAVAEETSVGIVKSYDNTLESAMDELGVRHVLVTEKDFESGDLSRFSTIILDIRAYLVREDLRKHNGRLLEYVRNGGNLVVLYQRDQEWKPEYAPYPFQITRRRITMEEVPVDALKPDHPLVNNPNRIVAADWDGWKQERGVYFPGDVNPAYEQLLSAHDSDEPDLTTGLLVATSGKGSYIYTSYVWYRQLKEYNPGAFRFLANFVSYPFHRK